MSHVSSARVCAGNIVTRRERFWRGLVFVLFGPRIACLWLGHPEDQCVWGSSWNGTSFHCSVCGHETFRSADNT